jgi:hypothetical protein
MEDNKTNILDVLSGNAPIKAEVSISTQSIIVLCLGVAAVIGFTIFILKAQKN